MTPEPELGDIRDEWHLLKPLLSALKESRKSLTWTLDSVYFSCLKGETQLWVLPEGYVLSQVVVDEHTNSRSYLVWIAVAFQKGGGNILKYLAFFDEVARHQHCEKLEVWSDVDEMEPRLYEAGFDLHTRVFTRQVTDGQQS